MINYLKYNMLHFLTFKKVSENEHLVSGIGHFWTFYINIINL